MPISNALSGFLTRIGLPPDHSFRRRINYLIVRRRAIRAARKFDPILSYSQFGEDAILQALLPNQNGFYIDIGSGHPVNGSNTYALYRKGWTGILVDPVLANVELTRMLRPRDLVIQAAVGDQEIESVEFIEFNTYQYSTIDNERAKEITSLGHSIKARYQVPVIKLKDITVDSPTEVTTVMSIDVEGQEISVLRSNDWMHFVPHYILVEDLAVPWTRKTEVANYLEEIGYKCIAISGVTCLYHLEQR